MEPKSLWNYFLKILEIPHASGKEEKLREYLIGIAKEHQLEYLVDNVGNLLIRKPATKGYESRQTVCLQSHLDMVCEKNNDVVFNFEKDPIKYEIVDGWIRAKGTTLGADNGIGIAAQLAILTANNIEHGNLECLFTVEEETGLTGAFGLQPNWLKSSILLNLDSEDDGQFFMGCAGGMDTTITLPYELKKLPAGYQCYEFSVTGLQGGHSGDDINKGRENAIKVCTNYLATMFSNFPVKLHHFSGGNLRNAIPREATAKIAVSQEHVALFEELTGLFCSNMKQQLAQLEPNVDLTLRYTEPFSEVLSNNVTGRLVLALKAVPHGVTRMSTDVPNLVETSTNLASIQMNDGNIVITTSQRSSVEFRKREIAEQVASVFALADADFEHSNGYPGWEPNVNSPILKLFMDTFKRLYHTEGQALAIHAGLECGLIKEKYPNMDIVSYGPTMRGVHSPDERLEIATVERFWELTLEVLRLIP